MAGNITGEVFRKEVIDQINTRQKFLGARYKTDSHLIYGNNVNAFLRLASSINIGTTPNTIDFSAGTNGTSGISDAQAEAKTREKFLTDGKEQLRLRDIDERYTGNELAKACVLFGGVVGVDNSLNPARKFGVYGDDLSSTNDPIGTIAAYGWGGIKSRGFVPMPSIESADVSFYNRGALAKAKVNIKVYSVEQLQIFDLLYFRIGYTMLLEWGHNIWLDTEKFNQEGNINPLTERKEFATEAFKLFFTEGSSQQNIIEGIKNQRKKDSYNYDGMLGKVTNFNWKFNADGSYDIELNLVGMGDIIETLKVNKANIITGKADITPSQKRNKKKDEINKKKEQLQNNTKPAENKKAAEETFNKAIADYNDYISKVNLGGKIDYVKKIASSEDDEVAAEFEKADIQKTSQLNSVSTNSAFGNLSDIAYYAANQFKYIKSFSKEQDSDLANNYKNYLTSLDTVVSILKNLESRLSKLLTLQSQAGIASDSADKADDNTKAELAALENALKAVNLEEEKAQLSPETSVETKDKSALNKQLYTWRQEAISGNNKDNLTKLTFTANSANQSSTGVATFSLNFYYVRLGYLLEWIQNNLLYYDTTKPYTPSEREEALKTGKPLGNPIFKINFDPELNYCLRFPTQFSSDPRVCVIPSAYTTTVKNETGQDTQIKWNVLPELKGYIVDNNPYIGKLMNMYVNIDHIAGKVDENTDANGKTSLLKFLTSLLNSINDALGNVNKLEPVFDSEANGGELKIIEGSSLENIKQQLTEAEQRNHPMAIFQIYGIGTPSNPIGSFITNVDFQVQLPPNMASMATISAQSSGNIVGENATGLSKMNTGLIDRLITFKLDKDSIEGAQTGKLDPQKIFFNNLQYVSKTINDLYQQRLFAPSSIDSIRSANRDVALYLTGNDALDNKMPPPFFIPFNLSLTMTGLSGMVNYERFSITEQVLPYSYRSADQGGVIDFLIKGISHTIKDNMWETKIESLSVGSNRKWSLAELQNTQAQQ